MAIGEADISPAANALLAEMLDARVGPPDPDAIEAYRAQLRELYEPGIRAARRDFDGDIEDLEIAGIPCKQVTPRGWSDEGNVIQYAYGGGYVSGSPDEDQIIALPLAAHAGARIVMVDYRLSPEHPYPEPQRDMQRVYPSLVETYGAARIAVCGESAGGNQALALLQQARNAGLPLPFCAALLSPWSDLQNRGDSHAFNDDRDPSLNGDWVDLAAALHAGGHPLDDPGISPLYGDLSGLPPIMITTGSRDLLLSQCLRLAQKLRTAGVDCDLRVWEGLWHVFEFYPIPEADASLREIAAFVRAQSPA